MGKLTVGAYAQNLGALLPELAVGAAKGGGLGSSEAGKIENMEYQDYMLFALILA